MLLVELALLVIAQIGNDSDLELVDVSFGTESGKATTLDVKVRNTGEKIAYLKEADFRVERVWELRSAASPAVVQVSGNYDVILDPTGAPYVRTFKLSQGVKPNAVDRFTFSLALNERARSAADANYVFLTEMDLVYDEDDKVVGSGTLLFVRDVPWQDAELYFPRGAPGPEDANNDPFYKAVREHNAQVVDEIGATEGTKSESLEKLIRYISERS